MTTFQDLQDQVDADYKRLEFLEQENKELRAHCERLRHHIREGLEPAENDESISSYTDDTVQLLNSIPAQSLAEIRAQAVEEFSDMLSSDFAELAYEYADQLRKEAE